MNWLTLLLCCRNVSLRLFHIILFHITFSFFPKETMWSCHLHLDRHAHLPKPGRGFVKRKPCPRSFFPWPSMTSLWHRAVAFQKDTLKAGTHLNVTEEQSFFNKCDICLWLFSFVFIYLYIYKDNWVAFQDTAGNEH